MNATRSNYNLLFSPHPSPAVTPSPEGEGFETHPIRETAVNEVTPTTNIFKGGTVGGHRPPASRAIENAICRLYPPVCLRHPPPFRQGGLFAQIYDTCRFAKRYITLIFLKAGIVSGHRPQNYNLLFSPHPSPAVTPSPSGEGFETHPIRETAVHEALYSSM